MTDNYKIKWEHQARASDPLEAATDAMGVLKSGNIGLTVTDSHGNETPIEMVDNGQKPYFRLVGLDSMYSPRTLIYQAEDQYHAREMAGRYGLVKVIYIERTVLSEETEQEIQSWISAASVMMGSNIKLDMSSSWGSNGIINIVDENGVMEMHNYIRLNDAADEGLVSAALSRVQNLCAQTLLDQGKTIISGRQNEEDVVVKGNGAQLLICTDSGEVMGWKAWTAEGYRWAVEVLIVDVIGALNTIEEDDLDINQLSFWTKHGDCIRPAKSLNVATPASAHPATV